MTRKKKIDQSDKNQYRVEYLVHLTGTNSFGYKSLKSIRDTPEGARREAKKYIHLGNVSITEKLTKTIETFPMQKVCT
jgi:hypothetical protein